MKYEIVLQHSSGIINESGECDDLKEFLYLIKNKNYGNNFEKIVFKVMKWNNHIMQYLNTIKPIMY